MSGDYRFLPWTRQGLATQVSTPDNLESALPARTRFPVRVTVNAGTPVGVDVTLYGPGDVVGVDPRGIIRTDPRRHATDVEPNYMAGIEFDRPDFPWMFTPAAGGARERLRPWCVLVVVEKTEGVAVRPDRNRPLPAVTVPAGELPPIADSWAWAHAQVITEQDTTEAIVDNIRTTPNLNVSRIVCPRRLEPNRSYLACLVPAFAAGVQAGLGVPGAADDLAPAWTGEEDEVELPVYFHWEFATGPGGDFESLARKLTPPTEPLQVGTSPMLIDGADPGLPEIDGPVAVTPFEGALVGPLHIREPALDGLAAAWLAALAAILDAPATAMASGDSDAPAVSPPLYGAWPTDTHSVPETLPRWFRELNLDPRLRAVAGLAAQVVRANQEELMHDAWVQVGNVLAANRLLDLARFSREGARSLHRKMFQPLSADELFGLAAPLHARVVLDQVTLKARLHASAVPDATADAAFRRMAAGRSRIMRRAARADGAGAGGAPGGIVARLDDGRLAAEPPELVPDGVNGAAALDLLDLTAEAPVDLTPMGGKRAVDPTMLRATKTTMATVGTPPIPSRVLLRSDLSESGVVLRRHLEGAVLGSAGGATLLTATALHDLVTASVRNPDAAGFLLPVALGGKVAALEVADDGTVTIRGGGRRRPTVIGRIASRRGGLFPDGPSPGIEIVVDDLPTVPGRIPPDTTRPRPGDGEPPDLPDGRPVPPLDKRVEVITRLKGAFTAHVATFQEPAPAPPPPPLGLGPVRAQILARTDPDAVVPARVASMIRIATADGSVGDGTVPPATIVTHDGGLERLTGSPSLERPMYEPLAAYAPELLLPGIGEIPTNTVALVKTNPRFVEAFLVGANTELGGELLWREYPARRDGTPLRRFWDRTDGAADIPEIRTFSPGVHLGESATGGTEGGVVLLVRGDLLRRYPTAAIYAVKATANGRLSKKPEDHRQPVLRGRIDPDVTFIGFDLTIDEVLADPGFLFVIQQQPTEPRFGFDVPEPEEGRPATWRDATWNHVGVEPGRHLVIDGATVTIPVQTGGATFVTNSAHLAAISLQQPVRVAIHARDLIGTGP